MATAGVNQSAQPAQSTQSARPAHSTVSNIQSIIRGDHAYNRVNQVPAIIAQSAPSVTVRPDKFSGEDSWDDYIEHFETVAIINNWTNRKRQYLYVHLSGPALEYVNCLSRPQKDTYEALCESLALRYSAVQLATVYKAELKGRLRLSGESIPALGHAIRKLVAKAYPSVERTAAEKFAIDAFENALTDREQRSKVSESSPSTLDEAVQLAVAKEAWQISERRRVDFLPEAAICAVSTGDAPPMKRSPASLEMSLIEKLIDRFEAMEKRDEERARKRQVICFNCDGAGHIAKYCKKERRVTGNENQSR